MSVVLCVALQGGITAGAAALKSWQGLLQAEPAKRRDLVEDSGKDLHSGLASLLWPHPA